MQYGVGVPSKLVISCPNPMNTNYMLDEAQKMGLSVNKGTNQRVGPYLWKALIQGAYCVKTVAPMLDHLLHDIINDAHAIT